MKTQGLCGQSLEGLTCNIDTNGKNNINMVKPASVVTSVKSNLPVWSPLLSQTYQYGHLC
jgi:hypothetical protein